MAVEVLLALVLMASPFMAAIAMGMWWAARRREHFVSLLRSTLPPEIHVELQQTIDIGVPLSVVLRTPERAVQIVAVVRGDASLWHVCVDAQAARALTVVAAEWRAPFAADDATPASMLSADLRALLVSARACRVADDVAFLEVARSGFDVDEALLALSRLDCIVSALGGRAFWLRLDRRAVHQSAPDGAPLGVPALLV